MSVLFGLDKLEPRKFIIVIAISFGGQSSSFTLPLTSHLTSLARILQSLSLHTEKSLSTWEDSSVKLSVSSSKLPVSFPSKSSSRDWRWDLSSPSTMYAYFSLSPTESPTNLKCRSIQFAPVCAGLNMILIPFFEGSAPFYEVLDVVGLPLLLLNASTAFALNCAVVFLIVRPNSLSSLILDRWWVVEFGWNRELLRR